MVLAAFGPNPNLLETFTECHHPSFQACSVKRRSVVHFLISVAAIASEPIAALSRGPNNSNHRDTVFPRQGCSSLHRSEMISHFWVKEMVPSDGTLMKQLTDPVSEGVGWAGATQCSSSCLRLSQLNCRGFSFTQEAITCQASLMFLLLLERSTCSPLVVLKSRKWEEVLCAQIYSFLYFFLFACWSSLPQKLNDFSGRASVVCFMRCALHFAEGLIRGLILQAEQIHHMTAAVFVMDFVWLCVISLLFCISLFSSVYSHAYFAYLCSFFQNFYFRHLSFIYIKFQQQVHTFASDRFLTVLQAVGTMG